MAALFIYPAMPVLINITDGGLIENHTTLKEAAGKLKQLGIDNNDLLSQAEGYLEKLDNLYKNLTILQGDIVRVLEGLVGKRVVATNPLILAQIDDLIEFQVTIYNGVASLLPLNTASELQN